MTAQGDAPPYGSTPPLRAPVAGIAATPDGHGYWLVAADGGVFSFGDATYVGGTPWALAAAVVGLAAVPVGPRVLAGRQPMAGCSPSGTRRFAGSAGGVALNQPVVGIAAAPSGRGYWLVSRDGGVFTFGDARYLGSAAACAGTTAVTGIAATADGRGTGSGSNDGAVFAFGSGALRGRGPHRSRPPPGHPPSPRRPDGKGYWEAVEPSRPVTRLGTFVATCYTGGGHTATGTPTSTHGHRRRPRRDPARHPCPHPRDRRTDAADTGGGIHGARIDIWQPSLATMHAIRGPAGAERADRAEVALTRHRDRSAA